jgi:hypothetical protein
VIHDVDESLRGLLARDVLNGSTDVEISFEAPTTDWAARRTVPTVDVYLYDIREDLERRDVMYEDIRDEAGRVTARRPPPRRFALSYLVTAWTQRPEDEHRLLAACLGCFLHYEAIPVDVLTGALADQDKPAYVRIALPPAPDRNISDVWSALGGELKPSLDLVITAPFVTGREAHVGAPVVEGPLVRLRDAQGDAAAEDAAMTRARRRLETAEARTGRKARDRAVLSSHRVDGAAGEDEPGRQFTMNQIESP